MIKAAFLAGAEAAAQSKEFDVERPALKEAYEQGQSYAYLELEKLGGAFEDLAINASRKVIKREVKHSMRDGETPSTRELRPVERYRSEDKRGNPSSGATLLR